MWREGCRNLVVAQERQAFAVSDSVHTVVSNNFDLYARKSPFYGPCCFSLCGITKYLSWTELLLVKSFETSLEERVGFTSFISVLYIYGFP